MLNIFKRFFVFGTIFVLLPPEGGWMAKAAKDQAEVAEITGEGRPVLWREPTDIGSRNLLYGSGGKQHFPRGPSNSSAKIGAGAIQNSMYGPLTAGNGRSSSASRLARKLRLRDSFGPWVTS